MQNSYFDQETRPFEAVMPSLPQDIVTGLTATLVALLFIYALWKALSAQRDDRWLTIIAAPFAAIAVYAPVSLPTAIALYEHGAGYEKTIPAGILSVIIGLGFIAAARHLLLLSTKRTSSNLKDK